MSKKNILLNKTTLITGGAGFIGSHLAETLLNLGADVIVFDNFLTGKEENLENSQKFKSFQLIKGDVNKWPEIKKVFENHKIDFIFHLAALVGVKRTLENPFRVLEDIEGIKNLVKLCRQYKVKKIIFSSSSEVYGDPKTLPEKEDETPLDSRLPYAVVKGVGENYFKALWQVYKIPTTSLRLFNVYGPRQDCSGYGFVIPIFISQVLKNQNPTIFGDGTQTRDFVFIKDCVDSMIKTLEVSESNGQIINIGKGKETTILELAQKIIKISGENLKPVFLPPRKEGEIKRRCPDVTKMKKILGFYPRHSLDEGLKITYDWFKENL